MISLPVPKSADVCEWDSGNWNVRGFDLKIKINVHHVTMTYICACVEGEKNVDPTLPTSFQRLKLALLFSRFI